MDTTTEAPHPGTAPTRARHREVRPPPARRSRRLLALALFPLAGVVAAACGSSGSGSATPTTAASTPTTAASTPATGAGSRPVVTAMSIGNFGKILVNTEGQVLYTFTSGGAPVPCSAACLQVWPALRLPTGVTTPTGGAGVGTLGTTTANGLPQVTVDGLPLFTYDGDSAPGVANGNGVTSFGGTWKVVKAT
jgi:predicted lipoprotein with Yx(FWY)xxD motif